MQPQVGFLLRKPVSSEAPASTWAIQRPDEDERDTTAVF